MQKGRGKDTAATAVEFLGHKVSAAGVKPLRSHVQAVLAHPEPTNISELQVFLGTVNFYRRFLPAAARTLKPLTDLLVGGPKGTWQPLGFFSRKLDSTQVKYSAFDRELLACFQAICHFPFMLEGRRFTLYTDHKPLTTAVRPDD